MNWALEFQKIANMIKHVFFTKFEYGYQNNAVFYADFEIVEKNVKKLL